MIHAHTPTHPHMQAHSGTDSHPHPLQTPPPTSPTHIHTCTYPHAVLIFITLPILHVADSLSEIQSNFSARRESLPAMFIATPFEKAESIWTEPHPTPPILSHMRRVARKAYDVLSTQLDPPTRRAGQGEGQVSPRDIKVGLSSICRLHCYWFTVEYTMYLGDQIYCICTTQCVLF